MRHLAGIALALGALVGAGCGGDGEAGDQPSAEAPGAAAAEEYDLVLPDDGVDGNAPPGVADGG